MVRGVMMMYYFWLRTMSQSPHALPKLWNGLTSGRRCRQCLGAGSWRRSGDRHT